MDILARPVPGLLDGLEHEVERVAGALEFRCETALVPEPRGHARSRKLLFQDVKDLGAHAHGLADVARADRHDHEFLDVDGIVGVFAAVDDVHHRHRQDPRRGAADIAKERLHGELGRRLGRRQRHAQDGVRAEPALVVGPVQFDHRHVEPDLVRRIQPQQVLGDLAVHRRHRLEHALARIPRLVPVALLDGLVGPRRGARGHRRPAHGAVFEGHVDLDGGVAPAVQDFAGMDVDDRAHGVVSLVSQTGSSGL
ncbi:probable phosphopyruvate hydratase [Pseudooceanicola batsensis HTCC2597]|uniref:Probable phosphopyruvate hydratase n=1 Tax=Pseudooceanicola batsensis (strain ATCC BAA-863 / DSM 15984 / KCTC 12145 / HTCC2597) TaxID=252305 RepID=A3TXJ1_PSEBH|nr:probable phosphopyruvate hydratase [Pseudooceanicola batsensis HTCC2597]